MQKETSHHSLLCQQELSHSPDRKISIQADNLNLNLFNEQVSIETKMKVEVVLDMKAQHGEFIGPRAPFGYQKSKENPSQLVPDPVAAVIVRKIFEMGYAISGIKLVVN